MSYILRKELPARLLVDTLMQYDKHDQDYGEIIADIAMSLACGTMARYIEFIALAKDRIEYIDSRQLAVARVMDTVALNMAHEPRKTWEEHQVELSKRKKIYMNVLGAF